MSDERMPRLHSRDLLSKWGFNDGDMPLDVFEWLEADSVDFFPAFSWDDVLLRLVREHLLPVLDQAVVVYEIAPHNPIRAETVEGVEVDCYDLEPAIALTPEYVDVPYGAVLAAVRDAITAKAGQP